MWPTHQNESGNALHVLHKWPRPPKWQLDFSLEDVGVAVDEVVALIREEADDRAASLLDGAELREDHNGKAHLWHGDWLAVLESENVRNLERAQGPPQARERDPKNTKRKVLLDHTCTSYHTIGP